MTPAPQPDTSASEGLSGKAHLYWPKIDPASIAPGRSAGGGDYARESRRGGGVVGPSLWSWPPTLLHKARKGESEVEDAPSPCYF
eukprot:756413-Hanusia_phi.AAC.5